MLKDSTTQLVLLAGNKKEKEKDKTHKEFQELILFLLHKKKV
jgi:hypothetical protein